MVNCLVVLVFIILASIIWCVPLWAVMNLVLWLFGSVARITIWQTMGLCALISLVFAMFNDDKISK